MVFTSFEVVLEAEQSSNSDQSFFLKHPVAVVIGDKLAMNNIELIVLDISNALEKFSFRYSQLYL